MNQEEFAQVVVEATDSLYRVSFAILGNDTDCKDAISEAIVTAFSKLYTLRNANYAKTWLTRILIHECYRILKTRKRLLLAGDEMEKKNLELLAQSLSRHGNVEEQTAEEIISKNWPAEPFLVMDELYTDGSSLYFSAHTPEGCSIRPTDTRDHAYVNGVDCRAEYFGASEEPGHFVGAIDLSANFSDQDFLKIGEELAILMQLYTKPDTDISDWTDWKLFSFSDPNWKESVATRDLSGKEITLGEYGSVKLEKLLVSPSKIKIKMICTMVGDNAKELLARYGYSKTMEDMVKEFHFIDSDGNAYSMWGTEAHGYQGGIVNGAQGGHVEKLPDGSYRWEFEYSIEKNFDMDTDSIRIIPCTMKEDEEGKNIPGSEREIPELAFEVSLK